MQSAVAGTSNVPVTASQKAVGLDRTRSGIAGLVAALNSPIGIFMLRGSPWFLCMVVG